MRRSWYAFTLVELLAVTGIITLLCAVLLPVLWSERQKARQTTCAANLKQIVLATLVYAQDYEGDFPYIAASTTDNEKYREAGNPLWEVAVRSYAKENRIFACPICRTPANLEHPARVAGYAINTLIACGATRHLSDDDFFAAVGLQGEGVPGREADLVFPASTILFAEVHFEQKGVEVYQPETTLVHDAEEWNHLEPDWKIVGQDGAVRHSGGSNYAFADGHTKWFRPEQILSILSPNDGSAPNFRP